MPLPKICNAPAQKGMAASIKTERAISVDFQEARPALCLQHRCLREGLYTTRSSEPSCILLLNQPCPASLQVQSPPHSGNILAFEKQVPTILSSLLRKTQLVSSSVPLLCNSIRYAMLLWVSRHRKCLILPGHFNCHNPVQ